MTQAELVELAKQKQRIHTEHSLHTAEKPFNEREPACQAFNCAWRPIACDNKTDVLECSRCGRQALGTCNFDEDFA